MYHKLNLTMILAILHRWFVSLSLCFSVEFSLSFCIPTTFTMHFHLGFYFLQCFSSIHLLADGPGYARVMLQQVFLSLHFHAKISLKSNMFSWMPPNHWLLVNEGDERERKEGLGKEDKGSLFSWFSKVGSFPRSGGFLPVLPFTLGTDRFSPRGSWKCERETPSGQHLLPTNF